MAAIIIRGENIINKGYTPAINIITPATRVKTQKITTVLKIKLKKLASGWLP